MTDISKISIERINDLVDKLNEINTKFDTINSKLNSMKYVVETGSNDNGWYRKWSDGWIEQGGYTTTANGNVFLIIAFSDTNYKLTFGLNATVNSYAPVWKSKYTTYFVYYCTSGRKSDWYACGY